MHKRLAMFVSAPIIDEGGDMLVLDKKFVSGMFMHAHHWKGSITCFVRRGAKTIPFGGQYLRAELPFDLRVLEADEQISSDHLSDFDVALLSGDSHLDILPSHVIRQTAPAIVYSIEYTHETRLQIIRLDQRRSALRKLYSMVWTACVEAKRRRAFRASRALQVNGYPAFGAYSMLNQDPLLYLDNRMEQRLFATDAEMAERRNKLQFCRPLRLINSGRLEPMKGAQDLIHVARLLSARGINFTLDIFGQGSLQSLIADQIKSFGLQDRVFLHAPVDFEEQLVPIMREKADVFLSCHRQSDPSCSYVEAMGCGLPIIGYDNRMLYALVSASKSGWLSPLGHVSALAENIIQLDADKALIVTHGMRALEFARTIDFQSQFQKRMEHLARVSGGPS